MNNYKQNFPCVHCGYCCTISPCIYGKWNKTHTQCEFLTEDNLCEKYQEIKNDDFMGFGEGCSSPLYNTKRLKKLKEMNWK